jgi:hypothetical protein
VSAVSGSEQVEDQVRADAQAEAAPKLAAVPLPGLKLIAPAGAVCDDDGCYLPA